MDSTQTKDLNNSEDSGKKINDLCNMSWLKHNAKSSSSPENQESNEQTERGKKPRNGKKRKEKKWKTESSTSESKDVDSKTSETEIEQNSKSKERRKPKVLPITAITFSNPPTVWNSKNDAASTLFPNAQNQDVDELEETLQLSKVLEESIVTAQLEKFRLTPEKDEINWADESEEPAWGAAGKNCPASSEDAKRECDTKMENKRHDDNNNRNNKSTVEQEMKKMDRYGRIDGRSERHLFQGKGARRREENFIHQHAQTSTTDSHRDRNRDQRNFHDRNSDAFSNRNRGHSDFDERNSHDLRFRAQRDGERNFRADRCSNNDRREFRNKGFPTSHQRENHRGNFQRDNHSHQRDNRDNQRDFQFRVHDTYRLRYNYRQTNKDPSAESNSRSENSQKQDNQQRHDHQFENRRQCPNEDQSLDSSREKEFKNLDKSEEENQQSTPELEYNESSTVEKIDSTKEKIEEMHSCASTSAEEESSSLVFMQESCKDGDSDSDNPMMHDHASETMSEKSDDNPTVSRNPYISSMPFLMHPQGLMCANEKANIQIPSQMGYKVMANPFMPVPVSGGSHYQHSQEIPADSGCSLPVQNMDMRFFQHPMNVVHNHPGNPYLPVMNYPLGMPMHSCGQMPVGNVGMNFMQPPVNCQCPSHYCQSRMPLQNVNCQNPMYPAQFVTPISSVPLPMAPISPEQIQSMRHPFAGKIPIEQIVTPVTEIGKSVSNLVSLCESIPSRRTGLANCPPGFENTDYARAMQKRIIYNKEQELPTFRHSSRGADPNSRKSPRKSEQHWDDQMLHNVYEAINTKRNQNKKTEDVPLHQETPIKFNKGFINEQIFQSENNESKVSRNPNTHPRPGFRIGLGRGKKLGPST